MLMIGDRDFPALIELDETIAAGIPGCELIRLPGSDHLPALPAPDLVAATVLRQGGLAA
ncbi:MAG: alpha/beta fold hydrolase [Streptosporangiaceae bacterium]